MEALFMQAFEVRDAAESQMRQQVDFHSQTLARYLLAAGHLPPPWLLPHPAALANPDPRGAAEAQMRQRVESHSQFLAGSLLAAGHRPRRGCSPPQTSTPMVGNTVTNGLANPRNVDHVNLLTETNHQAKQKTLEVGVKPGIMNITTSADRSQKCASETVNDSTGMHSSNENPSPANSLEVPRSDVSLLLQNDTLHPVEADFCEVPQPITILLPEKETTCAAETEPLEGLRSSTTPLLETAGNAVRKVSVDLANNKCTDHVHHVLPEINHWEKTPEAVDVKRVIMNITSAAEANQFQKCTRETVIDSTGMCASSEDPSAANSVEVPHSALSSLLHNDTLHSVDVDFNEAPHPITITSPQKDTHTAETKPVEDPRSIATPLLKIDSLHSVKTNFLEVLDSLAATNPENDSIDTAENDSLELSHSMVSLLVEAGALHSDEGNILEGNNSIASLLHDNEPILTDTLEGAHRPLLEKDTLHFMHTNHHEGNYFMPSVLLGKETTDAAESESFEGPSSMARPLVENGSSHSTKSSFLEEPDCVSSRLPENDTIEIVENVSVEVSQCTTSVQFDTAFASVASCSDFQERRYLRQENSSMECPNGGVKTARTEDYSKFDETMQECQSFNIPVPSNSLDIKDRASQAFCESTELINLSSSLSAKYKMKPLDGVYQSLPSRFEKLMNRSLSHSIDTNLLDPSYDSKKLGVFGKYSLDFDGAFMMSNELTYDSSNAYDVQEDIKVPLTHLVEKYNLEKLSGRTGSSSDYLGSIPELACFRIDEDSTILGENENQMKLSGSISRNHPKQGLAAKKPLGYATNIYQSKGTCRADLTAGKYYTRKPDRHVNIRVNQDIKNPKDNRAPSIRKDGKVTHPLLDRLSKAEMLSSKSERNRSETNPGKGCMPRNIVSNMTSFIPLVKQKQRPPTSCVKRGLRVRALEAAEAAKRREEKKKTDREKHKAAVELERERLKQEKEHRQQQVELQKKKDADIITRKRQRENDGKRGNDRKKKCVEEAPKHQKLLLEIMHSTNAVRDACPNNTDGKDLVENLASGVKNQLLYDERMDSVHRLTASESNSLKAASVDWKSEGFKLQVQGGLSDDGDKSYEMSPYEDSDEEDFDNLEHKREMNRACKLIPSWAQKENLNKILLSNQALDPREVFARKCFFVLSDVLTLGIPHRLFN